MIVCAAGGTTSHFLNTTPAEPLRQAVAMMESRSGLGAVPVLCAEATAKEIATPSRSLKHYGLNRVRLATNPAPGIVRRIVGAYGLVVRQSLFRMYQHITKPSCRFFEAS